MDEARVAELLGSPVVARRAATGGYTPAERWIVELEDGRSAFAKIAVNDLTALWLRKEIRVYADLRAPYMPELLGWADEGERPMLILEDLSACAWPPPWTHERVESVLATLEQVAATPPPVWMDATGAEVAWIGEGWSEVAKDPAPFLATGIVSRAWLESNLPALLEAGSVSVVEGDRLCHFDVRSDNLCFRADGSAVLVDWNHAAIGNARLDVAAWLPSLAVEGGPAPETILPDGAPEAAVLAGYFASRCGLPPIPDAPGVREIQMSQLSVALPWACRALGLPLP